MLGKGSPKLLTQAGSMKKKKRASPKAGVQVVRSRAHWNLGLERALVDLLHDHNNDCNRGQNGWSSDAWNRIVKSFHEKFKHISFSRQQTIDKEKELKREYRMLKEARKQSGASWDDKLCMIVADDSTWDNIIISYGAKVTKFKSKPFPLFERLGELYDGHTAEGSLNLTSLPKTTSEPIITQINGGDDVSIFGGEEFESTPVSLHDGDDDDNDDDVSILEDQSSRLQSSRPTIPRKAAVPDGGKKVQNRQKEADIGGGKRASKKQKEEVTHMMSRYLEVRTRQVECEVADKAKAGSGEDEYSIKNCISLVKTMQELTGEEKVEVADLFKDAQNREIFMSLDSTTRLIWTRKKCMEAQREQGN